MSPTKQENESAQESIKADFLKEHGFTPEEQDQAETNAYNGAAEDIADNAGLSNDDLYRAEGASAGASKEPSEADDQESDKFRDEGEDRSLRQRIRGASRRTKAGATTGIVGVILSVAGFIGIGTVQLPHLAQLLSLDFTPSEDSEDLRMNALFRYARSGGAIGETRVSLLGSRNFAKTRAQLASIGIEFNENKAFGTQKGLVIDIDKNPDTKGLTREQARGRLASIYQKAGITEADIKNVSGNKLYIDSRRVGISATRTLNNTAVSQLSGGKTSTFLKARVIKRYYNLPSAFHPLKRADAKITEKIASVAEARAREKARKTGREYKSPTRDTAYKNLQEKTSGFRAGAGAALLITAGTCLARDAANDAITYNREAIVVPQALEAADMIAVGSQQQSGMDFAPEQLDAINKLFKDQDGKTIWQGKALQAKTDPETSSGEELPEKYSQAFDSSGGANTLKDVGGKAGALACSDVGKIAQGVAGLVLAGLSIPSGGGTAAAYGALKIAGGAALGAAAMIALQDLISSSLKDEPIPEDIAAPIKGNLLAYGSRELANTTARAEGGIELSKRESAMLDQRTLQKENAEFQSKSFFAKIFDTRDYRSVASSFVRSSSSSKQNIETIAGGVFNVGPMVANTFKSLSPKAAAQDTEPYDYGFNRFGIPQRILDNEAYEDPYDNADKVAKLLNGGDGQNYIDKANKCFGVTIAQKDGAWGVTPEKEVNPNSSEYADAKCNDASDGNWDRIILFVKDTSTMEAAACYMGEEESCKIIGAATEENVCSIDSGVSISGMPDWAKLPVISAPVGGSVNGTIDYAAVNARSYDTFPDVLRIISGNNPDFIGLNEIANESIARMENSAPGYGAWKNREPDTTKGNPAQSVNNAIMWKKDKWELLQSGSMKITEDDMVVFDGENKVWDRFAVWGVFKRKSDGAITSFVSTHMMTNPAVQKKQHGDPPMTRIEQYGLSMDLLIQLTQVLAAHGPVVVAGDMNSHPKDGDWAAVPKMEAAGFGWVNDNAVIYVFNPKGTKITNNKIVTVPLHGDHQDHSLLTKIDMKGAGPSAGGGTVPSASTSTSGDCAAVGSTNYKNPIIDSQAPDPSVIKGEDGKYYLYATGFQQFVSKDMVNWEKKNDGMSWIKGAPNWSTDRWAPDIAKVGDTYILSVSGGNGGGRAIGYATSKSAGGPFTWQGMYDLPTSDGGGYNIDPNVLETDEGIYLYYGSGRGYIKAAKLKQDGNKFKVDGSPKKVFTTSEGVGPTLAEGAYVHKKDGYYYLFYSSGNWDGSNPPYRLHVARSKSPTGPFKGKGAPILEGNEQFRSPGHGSVLTDDAGTDWKIYHAYPKGKTYRAVLMDKITYVDGWPTITGPSSSKQAGPAVAGAGGSGSSSINMSDDYKSPQCENFRKGGAPGLACDGECVDFVKFRLKKNIDRDKFASLGNGKDVAINLGRSNYKVNNKPAVNAVVSWGAGQFGMNSTYGHVAMVSAVNKDGSITVEEYNVTPGKYSTRKIPADQASQLTYAHTEVDFK